ncbi:MAG: hypothetical protein J07HX64_00759 [halophilic archaeon J07HX64]|nr:MAG: hypothetical protein J07HX64_00759 [halophilic archaeon J07HX64]
MTKLVVDTSGTETIGQNPAHGGSQLGVKLGG